MVEYGRNIRFAQIRRSLPGIGKVHQSDSPSGCGIHAGRAGQTEAAEDKGAFRREGAGHGGLGGDAPAVQQLRRRQCADDAVGIRAQMAEHKNGGRLRQDSAPEEKGFRAARDVQAFSSGSVPE